MQGATFCRKESAAQEVTTSRSGRSFIIAGQFPSTPVLCILYISARASGRGLGITRVATQAPQFTRRAGTWCIREQDSRGMTRSTSSGKKMFPGEIPPRGLPWAPAMGWAEREKRYFFRNFRPTPDNSQERSRESVIRHK